MAISIDGERYSVAEGETENKVREGGTRGFVQLSDLPGLTDEVGKRCSAPYAEVFEKSGPIRTGLANYFKSLLNLEIAALQRPVKFKSTDASLEIVWQNLNPIIEKIRLLVDVHLPKVPSVLSSADAGGYSCSPSSKRKSITHELLHTWNAAK